MMMDLVVIAWQQLYLSAMKIGLKKEKKQNGQERGIETVGREEHGDEEESKAAETVS